MALFYQEDINQTTRLGIWRIEEEEAFFLDKVPLQSTVTHPHKRLQHLAGRFLLQWLVPGFPYGLIAIADTRKPYLVNEAWHFSISHCGDYAAAIVSSTMRVGIDIEEPRDTVMRVRHKFVHADEYEALRPHTITDFTSMWSAKEAVFKWYGLGGVDFKEQILLKRNDPEAPGFNCSFLKTNAELLIRVSLFDGLCLAYTCTPA